MTVKLSLPEVGLIYRDDAGQLQQFTVQVANPDMTYAERFAPKLGISGDSQHHPMTMMTIWAWRACKRTADAPPVLKVDSFTAFDETVLEISSPDEEEVDPTPAGADTTSL